MSVPPRIQSSIANVTVNEQDPIDLTCVASGHPVPTVTWTKDGKPAQSAKGGVIHISISTRQDAGVYVCIADNSVGQADQKKSYVTVNCKWVGMKERVFLYRSSMQLAVQRLTRCKILQRCKQTVFLSTKFMSHTGKCEKA